jgi:hypothetical protein
LIPFNSTGPATNALLGGQIDYMCNGIPEVGSLVTAGIVKAFAIATKERNPASECSDLEGGWTTSLPGLALVCFVCTERYAATNSRHAHQCSGQCIGRPECAQAFSRHRLEHSGQSATGPGLSVARSSSRAICPVVSPACAPSSHSILSASRPFFAAPMWAATTATASSSRTIWRTPFTVLAALSSTLFTRPPNTGDCASVAIFTPADGRRCRKPRCR